MKQFIKIIRTVTYAERARELLIGEQYYELASLAYALKNHDESEIERCKRRLFEIHVELKGLDMHEQLQ